MRVTAVSVGLKLHKYNVRMVEYNTQTMGFISEIKLEEFAHLRSLGSQEARLGKSRSTLRPQTTVIKDCHNSKKRLIYCADFQRNVLILSLSQTLLLSPESSDPASLASDTMNTRT